MADIFIFGDSIGYGAWDERGGWADRLKQYFHQQKIATPNDPATEVYNLSVDGDTSADVAHRIAAELKVRRRPWSTTHDIVLVAIGTNDAYAEGSPTSFAVSPEEYVNNLASIHRAIQELGLRAAYISLDPVDESRTNPCSWGPYYWTNARIQELNRKLNEFCADNNAPILNIFDEFLSHPKFKELSYDGAHPTTAGHIWMYDQIRPFVVGLLNS